MRALVLVVTVACSNERTGETAAHTQQRCESSQKLAISLVRERALFPRRLQVASERVERALRRQRNTPDDCGRCVDGFGELQGEHTRVEIQ